MRKGSLKRIRIAIGRIFLAVNLLFITTLSLVPVKGALAVNIWDKAQHTGAYLLLGLLAASANRSFCLTPHTATYLALYGVLIEVIQGCLPWRSFSLLDMVANAFGISLAALITIAFVKRKPRLINPADTNDQ